MELTEILKAQKDVFVIDGSIPHSAYAALDLSAANASVSPELVSDPGKFSRYIEGLIEKAGARAAFGGYVEKRLLYKHSALFNGEDEDERDIHIGLDIWAGAGTPVLAALDAEVHSFDYNAGSGNYGPTIVLKHLVGRNEFYTLYGHLSIESIEDIEIGDRFSKGAEIGRLGYASVNGNYPPHLHFQVIKDMGGNFGDYPGVCSESDLGFYLDNCPDPNWLLKIKHTTT